jgi:hypothetical protein
VLGRIGTAPQFFRGLGKPCAALRGAVRHFRSWIFLSGIGIALMIVEGRHHLLLGFLLVVGKRGEAGVAALTDAEQGIVRIHNVEIPFRHAVVPRMPVL